MESQIKQRIIGIIVLLILVIAIAMLLFYGAKQSDKNNAQVQLPIDQAISEQDKPSMESTAPISEKPQDVISPNKKELVPPVSDQFGKVNNSSDNNTNATVNLGTETILTKPDVTTNNAAQEPSNPNTNNNEVINDNNPNDIDTVDTKDLDNTDILKAAQVSKTPNSLSKAKTNSKPAPVKLSKHKAKAKIATIAVTGNWKVKAGSFAVPANAHILVKKLRAKGYAAYTRIAVTNRGALTQVFIGPEKTYEKALIINRDLQKTFHLHGIILKNQATKKANKGR